MAVRGAKPKPTPMHIMQGTYQECRHGNTWSAIEGEVVPPHWLTEAAMPYFVYLKETIHGIGCDSSTFSTALGTLAEAIAERNRLRDLAEATGGPTYVSKSTRYGHDDDIIKANPAYTLFMNQDKRVTALLTEFGLTPSSMSRLRGLDKKQEKNDPFADLLAQ